MHPNGVEQLSSPRNNETRSKEKIFFSSPATPGSIRQNRPFFLEISPWAAALEQSPGQIPSKVVRNTSRGAHHSLTTLFFEKVFEKKVQSERECSFDPSFKSARAETSISGVFDFRRRRRRADRRRRIPRANFGSKNGTRNRAPPNNHTQQKHYKIHVNMFLITIDPIHGGLGAFWWISATQVYSAHATAEHSRTDRP